MNKKFIYKIDIDEEGIFLERPNRFIAKVKLKTGQEIIAHVHDSGRLKELLYENNKVFLRKAKDLTKRKTEWDMIAALADDGEEILINSSFHRYITDILFKDDEISPFGKIDKIKAEVKYGESRLDYLLEKNNEKIWVETKGVSLSVKRVATFPDAPSIRATKHLNELMELKKNGNRAAIVLIVLRESETFEPKWETDPIFSETFYKAIEAGIEVYPVQFKLENGSIYWTNKKIKIKQDK
ncbi:MAG: DNA/RNA nuclease SfsA [Fusobacteriaceae bacterium]